MHYCKNLCSGLLRCAMLFWLFWLFWLLSGAAQAEGMTVEKAEVRREADGYHLVARYDVSLTQVMQQALSRGISLNFIAEFSLIRPRWYWMDEEVFQGEQAIKLSYNVLTRQYRISRGALYQNFASLDDALNILSRQTSPAIPAELLKSPSGYISNFVNDWIKRDGNFNAAVRFRLDNAQLPKLLQVNALSGGDWTLNSDWYRWEVSPADLTPDVAPLEE